MDVNNTDNSNSTSNNTDDINVGSENSDMAMRTAESAKKSSSFSAWGIVLVVLVVIFLGASLYVTSKDSEDSFFGTIFGMLPIDDQDGGLENPELLTTLLAQSRAGEYGAALDTYNEVIESSPNPLEHAIATRNSITARYKTGGDDEYLEAIRDLKAIVSDKNTGLRQRIRSLNTLAGSYSQSGENPLVYQEMFSGEPFSQFVVPGNPIASIRNLYEWGYAVYPTPKAGVAIAGLYVREVINTPDMNDETKTSYIAQTKQYLSESAALKDRDSALQDPNSNQLAGYKVWRAFAIAALELVGETFYEAEYKKEYESIENDFKKVTNKEALQYKPFAHWMYATFLLLNGESDEVVSEEIEKAVDFYNSDTNKEVNEFAEYMRNWKEKMDFADEDFMTAEVVTLMSLSPKFSDFIENI